MPRAFLLLDRRKRTKASCTWSYVVLESMKRPQWLEDLRNAQRSYRTGSPANAPYVIPYCQYAKQAILEAPNQTEKMNLFATLTFESRNLFGDGEYMDGATLSKLDELLQGFHFRSILRFVQGPKGIQKIKNYEAATALKQNFEYFKSHFPVGTHDPSEHVPPVMSCLTLDLWRVIGKPLDFNSLLRFAETSKFFYLFVWEQLMHELIIHYPYLDKDEPSNFRSGVDLIGALLSRIPCLSTFYLHRKGSQYEVSLLDQIIHPLCLKFLSIKEEPDLMAKICNRFDKFLNLSTLFLRNCELPPKGMHFIKMLTNLTHLDLTVRISTVNEELYPDIHAFNTLLAAKKLPKYSIEDLLPLTKLRKLRLTAHALRKYTITPVVPNQGLKVMSNLEILELEEIEHFIDKSSEFLEMIGDVPSLTQLSLSFASDQIPEFPQRFLSTTTLLKSLQIHHSDFTTQEREQTYQKSLQQICDVSHLTGLVSFGLPWMANDSTLSTMINLTALEELDISYALVTDVGLSYLQHLTNLSSLCIEYCSNEKITNQGFICLTGLTNLRHLWTEEGLEELQERFPLAEIHSRPEVTWSYLSSCIELKQI